MKASKTFPTLWLFLVLFVLHPIAAMGQEPGREPRNGRRRGRSWDISLILISTGDVQRELDITPSQGELLEALGEDLGAQRRGRPRGRRESSGERNHRLELPERLFRVVLDEEQFERLVQIGLQFKGPYAIEDEEFAETMALSDEQIDAIRKARSKKRDLSAARIRDLLGDSKAEKWDSEMGKTFRFRGELRELRTIYFADRQRADLREN